MRAHSDEIVEAAVTLEESAAKAAETGNAAAPVTARMRGPRVSPEVRKLAKRFHLHLVSPDQLKIMRKRAGDGFIFTGTNNSRRISDLPSPLIRF